MFPLGRQRQRARARDLTGGPTIMDTPRFISPQLAGTMHATTRTIEIDTAQVDMASASLNPLPVRSSALFQSRGGVAAHKRGNFRERTCRLRQEREQWKAVDGIRHNAYRNVHSRVTGACDQTGGIAFEDFTANRLNEKRREAIEIPVKRRNQWVGRIVPLEIGASEERQAIPVDGRVVPLMLEDARSAHGEVRHRANGYHATRQRPTAVFEREDSCERQAAAGGFAEAGATWIENCESP
jgi:hypothetical protein